MNQIISYPSSLVKCEKCGARYIYEPPGCNTPPMLIPLSLKGLKATIKESFKILREKNQDKEQGNKSEGVIITKGEFKNREVLFSCPICGGDLRKQRHN